MHIPVLKKEVIEYLKPEANQNFIDCTAGGGGHALAILERIGPAGRVLGIDWSAEAIKNLPKEKNLILVCDNFANLKNIIKREKFPSISGILLDLGMSSSQLTDSGRGFSFKKNEPLDMRYSLDNPLTAEKIVNFWSSPEIERVLKDFGEERFAPQIAREIITTRQRKPIKTTFDLVGVIERSTPKRYQRSRIHSATRTFQALRIATNLELDNLRATLPRVLEVLRSGGRMVIISFHSLEDRIVKNFFREQNNLEIITKKPIRPGQEEIRINPSSRSAKLRAAEKL